MKALFQGAPVVVMTGLLLGAALQPELAVGEAASPRIEVAAAPDRPDFDATWTVAAYEGRVPDYVLGTDWTHPKTPPPAPQIDHPDPAAYSEPPAIDQPPPPTTTVHITTVGVLSPAAPSNPSESGDILAGVASPSPQPQPAAEGEVEAFPPV